MHAYAVLAGCNKQGTGTADVTETPTDKALHIIWNVTGPHWLTSQRTYRRKGKEHPSTFSDFFEGDFPLQQLCPIHKHLHLENTAEPKMLVCLSYSTWPPAYNCPEVCMCDLTRSYHGSVGVVLTFIAYGPYTFRCGSVRVCWMQ